MAPPAASAGSGSPRLRTAVTAAVLIWAAGTFLAEAVAQLGAALCLLLALISLRRLPLEPDVARYGLVTLAYAGWQLLSTAVARLSGVVEGWPRGSKYGLIADTAAPAALGALGGVGLPWVALAVTLCAGWTAAVLFGAVQHFASSPVEAPAFVRVNVARVRENFGGEGTPRFAAGGFMFHRLRLSHGAMALLPPAAVLLSRLRPSLPFAAAALLVGALLVAPYLAFARAALVTGAAVALAVGVFAQTALRRRWIAVAALGAAGLVLLSPGWRDRVAQGIANVAGGERAVAMRAGWRVATAYPLLGVGHGNYQQVALRSNDDPELTGALALDAHNFWLAVWAETGLLGVLLAALSHGLLARALWRRRGQWSGMGALLALGAFHLLGLVHYLPFHPSVHLTFGLIWGLGLCSGSERLLQRSSTRA